MGEETRMETGTKKWPCGVIRPSKPFSHRNMKECGTWGNNKTLNDEAKLTVLF